MKRKLVAVASAVLLSLTTAAAAFAAAPTGEWHRLNPGDLNEHERLTCVESPGAWHCRYDKVDEDLPGFSWDSTTGVFSGRPVTSTWECPEWFPGVVCDNVVAVYTGPQTYNPFDDRPFQVRADYVVTEIDDQAVLYQSWVDVFACPWFRTWDEALAADPSCAFAP